MSGSLNEEIHKEGIVYTNRVFIGNLHTRMSEGYIRFLLSRYGCYPDDIKVIRDINGCSKGYCFVDFLNEDDVEKLLQEKTLEAKFGRNLLVKPAIRIHKKEVVMLRNKSKYAQNERARRNTSYTDAGDHVTEPASKTGLLSTRGVNKLKLNIPKNDVLQSQLVHGMQLWSPFTPSTPYVWVPSPLLQPDPHRVSPVQCPFTPQAFSPPAFTYSTQRHDLTPTQFSNQIPNSVFPPTHIYQPNHACLQSPVMQPGGSDLVGAPLFVPWGF